jgi:hypothetical protein
MGANPDGPDLTMGLGMQLTQDPQAMNAFGSMSAEQKGRLIEYLQGAATGAEAEELMYTAIQRLHGNESF